MILNVDRFEVTKNPLFHKSSRRLQIVRFVLVSLRAAKLANLSSIRPFEISTVWWSAKIRVFTNRAGDLKWPVLC